MIGILISNLGTPDAPTPAAVKKYLAEFLSDPHVIDLPAVIWKPILYGIILQTRPKKSAELYKKIWTATGSPLLVYSKKLVEKVSDEVPKDLKILLSMRYGNPSIVSALEKFKPLKIDKLIVLPLYPQYSGTTTGSTFDEVNEELKTWRHHPTLTLINNYHNNPLYIKSIAQSIAKQWQPGPGKFLLFSFHGIPKRNVKLGDPYETQCYHTAELVALRLQIPDENWGVAFQSRFGYAEWLQPYTDEALKELPSKGYEDVTVICPGFAVDCLETLEEIEHLNRDQFIAAGGKNFTYIPALNDSQEHAEVLASLIKAHL